MNIQFKKYQGTGNDFIMLDNLDGRYDSLTIEQISILCDRHFGIGADGLIKIDQHESFDFSMDYYNSDGSKSFCGNGARCAIAFAETLGVKVRNTFFNAIDGMHSAQKNGETIALDMINVESVNQIDEDFVLNTGSPHYIHFVHDLTTKNIIDFGKKIRYSDAFKDDGINVNLVEEKSLDFIKMLTYERGVENETLSCGTGATAAALLSGMRNNRIGTNKINVEVKGGNLSVEFCNNGDGTFTSIKLIGPALFVFKGEIDV